MDIGTRLKTVRNERGYTQKQLGEKLHVSRQTISKWENNNALPDINTLLLLGAIYEMTLQELLGEKSVIFEQKDVLDDEEKKAVLEENDRKTRTEMLTKQAKKFLFGTILLFLLVIGYHVGQEVDYQRQIRAMAVTLYGVTAVDYGTETSLTGFEYPILRRITLTDGTIINNPTIYQLEELGLTKKQVGKGIDVGPPMIIDYYKKYPMTSR